MKTSNRKYWEAIASEMEEAVADEFDEGIYNENHIPDLELLALSCPFSDLSERLINWAQVITCRLECVLEYEGTTEESDTGYFDLCFELYGNR
jgi:hypothetical protein